MSTKQQQNQQAEEEGGIYAVEAVEISSESDIGEDEFDEQSLMEQFQAEEDDLNDLNKLIATTKKEEIPQKTIELSKPKPSTEKRLEVVDDFIRNFLIKNKMTRSLEIFQQEWYELLQKGETPEQTQQVPDVYLTCEKLNQEVEYWKSEFQRAKQIADQTKATYDKLRKERDFHKMHHHRVQQEKKKQNNDIEKLKALHQQYEIKYEELSQKYAHAMKEKMLLKLERDRLSSKNEALSKSLQNIEDKMGKEGENQEILKQSMTQDNKSQTMIKGENTKKKSKWTPLPPDDRSNPYAGLNFDAHPYKNAILSKTFKGHMMAVSELAMHPKKSIVATASDDFTWKIWTLPQGELIMSGEGHKDWVSGIAFHPKGTHLATSSGDCTIKIWDFINASCNLTLKDHIQPVWGIAYHDTGDFLASASMDHTSKLFDLNVGKQRQTFRGHVDSVNNVTFQPYSNILATGSADKTISLWDIRTGLCIQTFYGHLNSINNVKFSLKGDSLASCDSDGIVKVWDVRMVKGRAQYDAGPYSANSLSIDKSGTMIAVANDEGQIKLFNDVTNKLEHVLKGHEDAVQDVSFDYNSKMIVSCGSDCTFRVWQ
ncbi:WD40-repeat-containing domain [Pseudocohnilembus persalinus]|uniref:WD40-repeat-containing domain n=1 Tax=Pseudocohnilembus persalinus TaxID=266149 RepID=A0A0V0QCN4_PSEPJ|nr:WD40-repeat-containing domain [Pseudocohnilembus persalinus]|eukprot:KRW99930.1 WD40-repeat-containing domain [Pseudocohnilembus persalinus]